MFRCAALFFVACNAVPTLHSTDGHAAAIGDHAAQATESAKVHHVHPLLGVHAREAAVSSPTRLAASPQSPPSACTHAHGEVALAQSATVLQTSEPKANRAEVARGQRASTSVSRSLVPLDVWTVPSDVRAVMRTLEVASVVTQCPMRFCDMRSTIHPGNKKQHIFDCQPRQLGQSQTAQCRERRPHSQFPNTIREHTATVFGSKEKHIF